MAENTEEQLIQQIRMLKQIKPRQDWVILTKSRILGKETIDSQQEFQKEKIPFIAGIFTFLAQRKAIGGGIIAVLVFLGIFGGAQNTVPGDLLYPFKKATEQAQLSLAPKKEKPTAQLKLLNKRLKELISVSEGNLGKKLAIAEEEVGKTALESAQVLNNVVRQQNSQVGAPQSKEIAKEAKEITKNRQIVKETLGIEMNDKFEKFDQSLNTYYKTQVEREIRILEGSTLSDEKRAALEEAKELYQAGNYAKAFEKILW